MNVISAENDIEKDDLASFCAEAVRGNNKASETTLAARDHPDFNIISAPDKVKGALDNDAAQGFRRADAPGRHGSTEEKV
jgi:hypothetical protein